IVREARPAEGLSPRLIVETTRKMNAKSGRRMADGDMDVYSNLVAIPLKLFPGTDYLFLVTAEGDGAIALLVDGKVAVQTKSSLFPFIGCRLLTPAQQNTGDPTRPRPACVSGAQRDDAMRIPTSSAEPIDVELVLINN